MIEIMRPIYLTFLVIHAYLGFERLWGLTGTGFGPGLGLLGLGLGVGEGVDLLCGLTGTVFFAILFVFNITLES